MDRWRRFLESSYFTHLEPYRRPCLRGRFPRPTWRNFTRWHGAMDACQRLGHGRAATASAPWWAITMLRDADQAIAFKQSALSESPLLRACMIPKVGSKLMKRTMCLLHERWADDGAGPLGRRRNQTPTLRARLNDKCKFGTPKFPKWRPKKSGRNAYTGGGGRVEVATVRDPLERLLSGYLDKCVNHARHDSCRGLLSIEGAAQP